MRFVGNVIWLVLGGFALAIGYALAGVVMCVLIVTIPFGIQAFKLAGFALWPFGRTLVPRPGAGPTLSFIGNLVWVIFAGFWLALGHLVAALLTAVTIIGIPFAVVHLKLARACFAPFGYQVVPIAQMR